MRKKEKTPDGRRADENVFDIMQGVAITIFVKKSGGKSETLSEVWHYELFGSRKEKFDFLDKNSFKKVPFKKLSLRTPDYFIIPKDYTHYAEYKKGFSVQNLFKVNSVGVTTLRDNMVVHFTAQKALQAAQDILDLAKEKFYKQYALRKDTRD